MKEHLPDFNPKTAVYIETGGDSEVYQVGLVI